jgi:hypothetical protein
MAPHTARWAKQTANFARRVDPGARAKVNASGHHILRIGRIRMLMLPPRVGDLLREEFMRGVKRGNRHLNGRFNWRFTEWPKLTAMASALARSDTPGASGFLETVRSSGHQRLRRRIRAARRDAGTSTMRRLPRRAMAISCVVFSGNVRAGSYGVHGAPLAPPSTTATATSTSTCHCSLL